MPVPVVWSPDTRLHDTRHEVWVGVPTHGTEVAERVDRILSAVDHREKVPAVAHDDSALESVHDPALLDFLRTCHERWRSTVRPASSPTTR